MQLIFFDCLTPRGAKKSIYPFRVGASKLIVSAVNVFFAGVQWILYQNSE
jgi:hypothetical protein